MAGMLVLMKPIVLSDLHIPVSLAVPVTFISAPPTPSFLPTRHGHLVSLTVVFTDQNNWTEATRVTHIFTIAVSDL
jgi:hypothetical protein